MLQDVPYMTRDEIYRARFEIAGIITQSRGLMTALERGRETRAQGNMLRREIDAAALVGAALIGKGLAVCLLSIAPQSPRSVWRILR